MIQFWIKWQEFTSIVLILLQICESFKEISFKLRERPNTIEDLTEQREYIKSIPESVTSQQSRIDQAMADYDMIEEYFYPLSDDDFNLRYNWNVSLK